MNLNPKQLFVSVLALCLPLGGHASSVLTDAFPAYVQWKSLEERSAWQGERPDPAVTNARIEFFSILREGSGQMNTWERAVAERLEKGKKPGSGADPMALDFLGRNFSEAKQLSPIEWEAIKDWFGPATQEEFLKQAFAFQSLPRNKAGTGSPKVIWIRDPYQKLLSESDGRKPRQEKENQETIQITAYAKIEDQAEELKRILLARPKEPFILASSGEASAIVHKTLDLYPGLREMPHLKAWVNVNGRLYGRKPKSAARSPASLTAPSADRFEHEALIGLKRLRLERLERPVSLGRGFPIFNMVSLQGKNRAAEDLRETIAIDGTTWLIDQQASPAETVERAVHLISAGP